MNHGIALSPRQNVYCKWISARLSNLISLLAVLYRNNIQRSEICHWQAMDDRIIKSSGKKSLNHPKVVHHRGPCNRLQNELNEEQHWEIEMTRRSLFLRKHPWSFIASTTHPSHAFDFQKGWGGVAPLGDMRNPLFWPVPPGLAALMPQPRWEHANSSDSFTSVMIWSDLSFQSCWHRVCIRIKIWQISDVFDRRAAADCNDAWDPSMKWYFQKFQILCLPLIDSLIVLQDRNSASCHA